ncbi:MAG: tetratricopeptide repeat protein [Phycisphaerae bacterium]
MSQTFPAADQRAPAQRASTACVTPRRVTQMSRHAPGMSLVVIGLLAVGGAGCQTPTRSNLPAGRLEQTRLEAALQLAEQHLLAGEFERARRVLAPLETNGEARACVARARIELEEGHYEAALECVDQIRAAAPGTTGASVVRLASDTGAAAPPDVHPAGLSASEAAAVGGVRAVAYAGLGRWPEAGAAASAAYRAAPHAELLALWVEALVQEGRTDEALATLQRERRHFPGERTLAQLAVRLLAAKGDFDAVRRESGAHADDSVLRQMLADALTDAGRFADALPHWQWLLADAAHASPGGQGAAVRRARLQRKVADSALCAMRYADATAAYRDCIAADPDDAGARLGLSAALLGSGAPREALAVCDEVLLRWPRNQDAKLMAAACHHALGQASAALRLLGGAAPDDDVMLTLRARAAAQSASAGAAPVERSASGAAPP